MPRVIATVVSPGEGSMERRIMARREEGRTIEERIVRILLDDWMKISG